MKVKQVIKKNPHSSSSLQNTLKWVNSKKYLYDSVTLATKLVPIITSGFDLCVNYSIQDVLLSMEKYEETFLLTDIVQNIYGFGMCTRLKEMDILYLGKICIQKEQQGLGYGRKLLSLLLKRMNPSMICAKTQNPLVMRLFEKLGATYPFDKTYDSPLGKNILVELVQKTILERGDISEELLTNGIIRNAYNGRLGRYPSAVYTRHMGINRDEGDAYLICTKLNTT